MVLRLRDVVWAQENTTDRVDAGAMFSLQTSAGFVDNQTIEVAIEKIISW
jgi:hypothetical protein